MPQTGFGWSNGVALRLLHTYGGAIEVVHADERHDTRFLQHPLLDGWAGQAEAVLPRQLSPRRLELLTSSDRVRPNERARMALESLHASMQTPFRHGRVKHLFKRARALGQLPAIAIAYTPRELSEVAPRFHRDIRRLPGRAGRQEEEDGALAAAAARQEASRRQREAARRAAIERLLGSATRHGWLICQTRPYLTVKDLFDKRTQLDWRELAGRPGGKQRYQFGDLSRAAYMRLRNKARSTPAPTLMSARGDVTTHPYPHPRPGAKVSQVQVRSAAAWWQAETVRATRQHRARHD